MNTNNDCARKVVFQLNHPSKPTASDRTTPKIRCQSVNPVTCQNYHQSVIVTGSRFELYQHQIAFVGCVGDNRSSNNVHQDENKARIDLPRITAHARRQTRDSQSAQTAQRYLR